MNLFQEVGVWVAGKWQRVLVAQLLAIASVPLFMWAIILLFS